MDVHPTLNRAARQGRSTEDEQLFLTPYAHPQKFTESDPWRVLRIQSEFVEGFDALAELGPAVSIFGSARAKRDQAEYRQAVELGRRLGEAGFAIITGGGPGIMEAGNKGASEAGSHSIGLNIELPFEQRVNPYVDLAIDFRYFFVRKTMFVKYSHGLVIFPGGFGTMDELFESLTLIQTGKVHNFPIVLFDSQYWEGLLQWLRQNALKEGKIADEDMDLVTVTDDVDEAARTIIECTKEKARRQRQEANACWVTQQIFHCPIQTDFHNLK